jgi:serine/threonine-protein kinase
MTTDPLLGRLVDGRYEISARIARGGMATVYLARDRRLDRDVALKVMHAHLADGVEGAAFVSRFRREARAAARLAHPGVVAVYDQGFDGETSYLTMEYVPGTNLRRELRATGTLELGRTLDVLDEVLGALATAHRKGLVHRDIKPENVLITAEEQRVKVADFGLARAVTEVTSTATGTILGTIAYRAPEVITTGACDARTDIYSVGILAYEMLTGTLPHDGSTPIQVAFQHVHEDIASPADRVAWLPPQVAALVLRFTARDPRLRPADGAAALEELRVVRSHLDVNDPEVLARRADPPSGFVPTQPVAAPSDGTEQPPGGTSLDGTEIDAIPMTAVATALDSDPEAAGPFPEDDGARSDGTQPTELLVEKETTRVTVHGASPGGTTGRPRRRRWPRVVAWVLALSVIAGGAGYGAWWWFEDGPGAWTTVPDGLASVPYDDATAILTEHGLDATRADANDDTVPEGSVVSMTPGEGERIRRDGAVKLIVSLGIRMVTVPEGLVGLQQADAEAALTAADVATGPADQEWSDTVPAGQVMSVSHDGGSSVPHTTKITLTVSGGPAPATVTQQVGRDKADAQAALEDLGFVVAFTDDEASETVPAGRVIRQTPESGTQAHRLDTVTLTISSGPPIIDVPNVVGKRTADAQQTLTDAGFKVDTVKYLGGILDTVRFQDPDTTAPKGSTVRITVW